MALIQLIRDEFGQMYEGKQCKDCEEIKPVTMFRKSGKYYNSYCKDCFRIRNKAYNKNNYYPKNSEKILAKYHDGKARKNDSD